MLTNPFTTFYSYAPYATSPYLKMAAQILTHKEVCRHHSVIGYTRSLTDVQVVFACRSKRGCIEGTFRPKVTGQTGSWGSSRSDPYTVTRKLSL